LIPVDTTCMYKKATKG